MQLFPIQPKFNNNYNRTFSSQTFKGGGKPLTLQYIVEKRSNLLPERILNSAKEILAKQCVQIPSLLELHTTTYAPLLQCKTLDEAKMLFPEFNEIRETVFFERNSRYAREFKERTDKNFALKMLQEFWANLKTKDEIAQDFGMLNRNSLEWPLKQIGFVSYSPNYKTLLKASDENGNKTIAAKTAAWNALHPDLMYARNKVAAQGCKTQEYREAQAKRMKEYDKNHPERREKIGASTKETWDNCPEIKSAMSQFAKLVSPFTRKVVMKRMHGAHLSPMEERINKTFYKEFWSTHPEFKTKFAQARNKKKKV